MHHAVFAPTSRRAIFPLNELRTAGFMMGSAALLLTAWVVSDNAPGTSTSVWPVVFMALGWIYALLAPVLINLTAENHGARAFLVQEGAFHLPPAALVTWFTTRWVTGTAYDYLAAWCWWALGTAAVLAMAGLLYTAWRGSAGAIDTPP